jgi:hypothetical protein
VFHHDPGTETYSCTKISSHALTLGAIAYINSETGLTRRIFATQIIHSIDFHHPKNWRDGAGKPNLVGSCWLVDIQT